MPNGWPMAPESSYSIGSSPPREPVVSRNHRQTSIELSSKSQTVMGTSVQGRKDGVLGEISGSQLTEWLQPTQPPLARGHTTSATS